MLDDVCARIKSGYITLKELSKIREKTDHVKKLLSETLSDKDNVITVQLLEIRFKEQNQFVERLRHLGQLCLNINIPVKGEKCI